MSIGTIVVGGIIIAVVAAIIWHMVRVKRSGGHVSCEDCPSSGSGCCGCGCGSSDLAESLETWDREHRQDLPGKGQHA